MGLKLAAALIAVTCASPALAQQTSPNFSGLHIAPIAGWDHLSVDGDSTSGFLYGANAGFDFGGNGGPVFGVEGEIADSTTDKCEEGVCASANRDLYIGGRAGVVMQDVVLLYVKGGYTNARVSASLEEGTEFADEDSFASVTLDGLRGGVGAEWATGMPFTVKLEYRYSNYEDDVSRHQAVLGLAARF